jgi:HAD superfamily hydrolase (TIGR01509 family)
MFDLTAHRSILARSHWVFDLDGTLTEPVHDFAAIRAALGIPDGRDILGYLGDLSPADASPLYARLDVIELELCGRTAAAPGALRLLEELTRRGVRVGVLTRNTRANALRTLAAIGVGPFFAPSAVLGRDDALPKPDPDGINQLSAYWGVTPEALVMVGDYLFDLQTGRAAGAATVHVDRSRTFPWPELADVAVGTLDELVAGL